MITVSIGVTEVVNSNPQWLEDAAVRIGARALELEDQQRTQRGLNAEAEELWVGTAADASRIVGQRIETDQRELHRAVEQVQTALETAGSELSATRTAVVELVQTLTSQGWQVADDGAVSVRPGEPLDRHAKVGPTNEMRVRLLAADNTVKVQSLLAQFEKQDSTAADRIRAAAAAAAN